MSSTFNPQMELPMNQYKILFQHQYMPYYTVVTAKTKEEAAVKARKQQGHIWISKVIKISK